jgi:serine/threonine protein phosphatase PrpC
MQEAKNTARALVRIGYDGRVHKAYRAADARQRFEREVEVLRYLEARGCEFVPRLLEADPEKLEIVTTHCGARVEQMGEERIKEIFAELEQYGVRHDDPFLRNITYRALDGRFCIIDFEFATILDPAAGAVAVESAPSTELAIAVQAVRWSGATEKGPIRPNNEDAWLGIAFDQRDLHYLGKSGEVPLAGLDFVFAVSDGMGGEQSGEFASRFAIDNITRRLPRRFRLSPRHNAHGFYQILQELFEATHRQLSTLGQSHREGRNMGATLSLVWIIGRWVFFGHLGDSRIYSLNRSGMFRMVSEDHTHVGWLRRQGRLNEREARTHPRKNVLSQSLGAGAQFIHPQMGCFEYEPGDRLLLCTDGVIEGLWDRAIEERMREPHSEVSDETMASRLVREALAESGRDNATAVLIELL